MSNENAIQATLERGSAASEIGAQAVATGRLIVVSAPSGAGKSSLVDLALNRVPRLRFSISCTTRPPRGQEKDGVDYFFVTEDRFTAMRDRGEFLEWAEVHGHFYGTPVTHIEDVLGLGEDLILDIDVKGADQVRGRFPGTLTVFVLPPSKQALEDRLRSRNLNSAADIECRMRDAADEVHNLDKFDYVIINDDLERAAAALESIIIADRHRLGRERDRAKTILSTFGGD